MGVSLPLLPATNEIVSNAIATDAASSIAGPAAISRKVAQAAGVADGLPSDADAAIDVVFNESGWPTHHTAFMEVARADAET